MSARPAPEGSPSGTRSPTTGPAPSGRATPIRLFGPPRLADGAVPIPDRLAFLLAMLTLTPGTGLRRADVAGLLWPDPATARGNLRQFLNRLTSGGAELAGLIDATPEMVTLTAAGQDSDLNLLCRAVADGNADVARAALIPLEGPLLEGVASPSSAAEDWLREARSAVCEKVQILAGTIFSARRRIGGRDELDRARILAVLTTLGLEWREPPASARAAAAPDPAAQPPRPRLAFLRPDTRLGDNTSVPADRFLSEVADRLSAYRTFTVLACHSTFQLDPSAPTALADRLKADYTAHSEIGHGPHGLVLTLRLVREAEAEVFWATAFDIDPAVLVQTGSRIVRHIATTLADAMEAAILAHAQIEVGPSAFLSFMQGRSAQARSDLPAVRRARNLFAHAIRIEPGFGLARARMAETLVSEWLLRGGTDGTLLDAARDASDLALDADRGAAAAHRISGMVALYQRRYDRVLSAFETAEALHPNDSDLLLDYADAESMLGDTNAAEALFLRAIDLNPAPPDRYWWFGASIALACSAFGTAASRCEQIGSPEVGLGTRAASYALIGDTDRARYWADQIRLILPGQGIDDLADLVPGDPESDMHRNYREGLRRAGLS